MSQGTPKKSQDEPREAQGATRWTKNGPGKTQEAKCGGIPSPPEAGTTEGEGGGLPKPPGPLAGLYIDLGPGRSPGGKKDDLSSFCERGWLKCLLWDVLGAPQGPAT